ncbi:MAG: hypothetical protein ABIF11_04090 [Nitrospirota bacterium]
MLIISLLAYTLGRRIFSIWRFEFSSIPERIVFSIGLGFCVLSYLIMGLGFLKLLEPKIVWGLIFVLIVLLFKDLLKVIHECLTGLKTLSFKQFSGLEVVLLFFLLVTGGLCLLQSLCPPFDWDDLAYHLQGPKLFMEHRRIFHIQDIAMANLPANIGMLYLLGMLLSSDILAKLFHFLFGILTVIGIISLIRRYFNPKSSLLASCIFYICPLVIFLSRTAYIDLGLTFYELLSVYAFLNWMTALKMENGEWRMENGEERREKKERISFSHPLIPHSSSLIPWLVILAIMCGFVVGIKYTGIYNVIILGLSILGFGIVKLGLRKTLIHLAIFTGICCLVGCPWYIKNFVYTHNPFYPFLQNLFINKVSLTPLEVITAQTSQQAFTIGKGLLNSLLLPWNITIQGSLGSLPFGATISPIYLMLLPLLIFTSRLAWVKTKIVGIYLTFYIVLKFILWSLGLHSSRYLLPLFPLLAIVLTGIFYTIFDIPKLHSIKRVIIFIIIGIWGAILSWDGFQIIHYRNPINFILGFESRDDFIRRNAEKGYYNAMKAINAHLPKESRIFFIGERKGYYCQRNYIPDFSPLHWTWKYLNYKDMAGIREYFKQNQITHILVNTNVISCYYYPDNGVSVEDVESFNVFAQTHLKLLFKEGSLYLYAIQ